MSLLALTLACAPNALPELPAVGVFGLELPTRDVARAERAYRQAFGFERRFFGGEVALLEKQGLTLLLMASPEVSGAAAGGTSVHLNLVTSDLEGAAGRATAAGFARIDDVPRAIAIGRCLTVVDEDGVRTNLIELAQDGGQAGPFPALFNIGLNIEPETDAEFLAALGFEVLTRSDLPDSLPIARRGAAELVLHRGASAPRQNASAAPALLLGVSDLEPWRPLLAREGLVPAEVAARGHFAGRRLSLRCPSNLRVELVERSPDQQAFERLFDLAGTWEGSSTMGWSARIEVEVIARGSAVLERSNFEAHPGETMLSLFHMDQGRLVLQHTCVAGNQPLLEASVIADDRLGFRFRSGLDLASRDQGHMDAADFRFEGPDAFSSRWSYYQDGRESWMEEIHYERARR